MLEPTLYVYLEDVETLTLCIIYR